MTAGLLVLAGVVAIAALLYAAGMTAARDQWRDRSEDYRIRLEGSAAQLATTMTELAAANAAQPRVVRVEVGPGGLLEVEVNGQPLSGTVVTEARDAMSCARLLLVDLDGEPPAPHGPAEALLFALDDRAVPV